MKLSLASLVATVLFVAGSAAPAVAGADGERLLGSTRLSKVENDTDVMRFAKCRRGIHAVQLRVARGQVEIEKLWVRYARGGVDQLEVRERIGENKQSRWIDLRGGERCIKAIGVIGDTELSLDQARVDIWGR